jgi:RNA polymerase sigma-70 factor (ECF subfamily)
MKEIAAILELQERIALYEDMKAYSQLYELLYEGLYRLAYSLVRSSEVSEEIVSDVFIKVWQIRSKLMEIEHLRVYLFTIAKNFSLNYITKNYKNLTVSLDDIDVEAVVEFSGPAEMCISADIVRQIRKTIQQLPPQCRLIFQLVKEEGLKYKEVAAILAISPLTVRNQLAIAVRKIAEVLPGYLQSPVYFSNKFSRS